jgi:hypothetical protein
MATLQIATNNSSLRPALAAASKPAAMSSPKMWSAVIGSTLGAFMAVLNIQIVNASLADIQGAIGAGTDDGGWISTSYLIAEIVVIPLSAWLARVFSLRSYLLANAILFLILRSSSRCCRRQSSRSGLPSSHFRPPSRRPSARRLAAISPRIGVGNTSSTSTWFREP